jgi:hypothetical protein
MPADRLRDVTGETAVPLVGEAAYRQGELRLHPCADTNLVHAGGVIPRIGRVVRIVGVRFRCDRHGEGA